MAGDYDRSPYRCALFVGNTLAQHFRIDALLTERCFDFARNFRRGSHRSTEKRVEKSGGTGIVIELAVFEIHVHALVEQMTNDLHQLLMDVFVSAGSFDREARVAARQRDGERAATTHIAKRTRDHRIPRGGPNPTTTSCGRTSAGSDAANDKLRSLAGSAGLPTRTG